MLNQLSIFFCILFIFHLRPQVAYQSITHFTFYLKIYCENYTYISFITLFSFTDKSSLCSDVGGSKSLSTLSMVAAGGVGGRLFACRWPTPVISCKRRQLELTKRRPYRRPVTYNKTRTTAEYISHMMTASSSSFLISVARSLLYDTTELHARCDYAGLFRLLCLSLSSFNA